MNCKLPFAIDVEPDEEIGGDIKEKYLQLIVDKLTDANIKSIVFLNARYAAKYCNSLTAKLWLAYYLQDNIIPKTTLFQQKDDIIKDVINNKNIEEKTIGWQFSDSGVDHFIDYKIDLSVFDKSIFEDF